MYGSYFVRLLGSGKPLALCKKILVYPAPSDVPHPLHHQASLIAENKYFNNRCSLNIRSLIANR